MRGLKTISFSEGENGSSGHVAAKGLRVAVQSTLFCTGFRR
jgi:hypothetical protein